MPELRGDKLREVGDLARELVKLKEHPSWAVIKAQFEEKRDAYLAKQARELLAGGLKAEPLDQRRLDYQRGFFRGAAAVFDAPDNAVAELERLQKEIDG